jgi:ribosomal protein L11 methyltransferase
VPSSWLQLSLRTDPAALDAVSNFLIERGSPGVVIKRNEVQAYFPQTKDFASLQKDVQKYMRGMERLGADAGRLQWKILKDRNWNYAWRRFFYPQRVGRRFLITPPWITPQRVGNRNLITIEPGMAFGTGTHATTRGCIEFIEQVASSLRGAPFTGLDVGTGSGILSIALAKIGAKTILALDNDPVAVKVARENITSNGVQGKIRLSSAKVQRIKTSFLVVVANLTAETILDLAEALEKKVAAKGFLILGGILATKAQMIVARFEPDGFKIIRRKVEKEWATLLLKRR